jgi:hypothetical protein
MPTANPPARSTETDSTAVVIADHPNVDGCDGSGNTTAAAHSEVISAAMRAPARRDGRIGSA